MGHGIAQACAQVGSPVSLVDVDAAVLPRALKRIEANLANLAREGFIDANRVPAALASIITTTDYQRGTSGADLIIEAVPEDLELKRQVFAALERSAPGHAILATNTASLRIAEIARATSQPERVIGTHWFFPPYVVPLVEVIPSERTSPAIVQRTKDLLSSLRKIPSVSRDVPGFVMVRLLHALLNEAINLLENGVASAEDIDNAFRFGGGIGFFLYGPLLAHDLTVNKGTTLAVAEYLYRETGLERFRPPESLARKVANGETGLLAGKGWYDFTGLDTEAVAHQRDALFVRMIRTLREAGLMNPDLRAALQASEPTTDR